MKRFVLFSMTAAATLAFTLQAAEIPAGAHVLLRMQNSVSSRTADEGDFVYLRTATPLVAEGRIVIPVGSYVQGVVARVERPGRVKGRAELAIRLESITLESGSVLQIAPRIDAVEDSGGGQQVVDEENTVQQGSSAGSDAGRVAILTASGASIGALIGRSGNGGALRGAGIGAGVGAAAGVAQALLTRGNEVELRQGMTVDVVFDRAVVVE